MSKSCRPAVSVPKTGLLRPPKAIRIEDLPGAAAVAIGALNIERTGIVLDQRFRSIGKLKAVRIDSRLEIKSQRALAVDWLVTLDADMRWAEPVRKQRVAPAVAVF